MLISGVKRLIGRRYVLFQVTLYVILPVNYAGRRIDGNKEDLSATNGEAARL